MRTVLRQGLTVVFLMAGCQGDAEHGSRSAGPQVEVARSVGTGERCGKLPAAGWRRDGTGRFPACTPPIDWADDRNVLWRTKIGSSYSSPVVLGDRVFAMAEPDRLVAVSAADGKVLWDRTNRIDDLPEGARPKETPRQVKSDCGQTTPTPVTDGRNVYVSLNSGIVAAYDLDGNRKWITLLDRPPATAHGRSASPVLAGGLLVVHVSWLHAIDPDSGRVVWEAHDAIESYGTPAVAQIGGRDVLVTPRGDIVRASDGAVLASGVGALGYATPVVQGRMVYFVDAFSVAFELPDEMKDKIDVKERWFAELEGEFFASSLLHEGLLYAVNATSDYYVLDAGTGETVLKKTPIDPPLPGADEGDGASMYASVSLAGNRIFLSNNRGGTLILEAGREYKEVRRNKLADGSGATATFDGNRLFLRAGDYLYCIGRPARETPR